MRAVLISKCLECPFCSPEQYFAGVIYYYKCARTGREYSKECVEQDPPYECPLPIINRIKEEHLNEQ